MVSIRMVLHGFALVLHISACSSGPSEAALLKETFPFSLPFFCGLTWFVSLKSVSFTWLCDLRQRARLHLMTPYSSNWSTSQIGFQGKTNRKKATRRSVAGRMLT